MKQNTDRTVQEQLVLYKPLSTIRELITANFVLQIIAPKRDLYSRRNPDGSFMDAGPFSKRYRYFSEASVISYPYGYTYQDPSKWNDAIVNGGMTNYPPADNSAGGYNTEKLNGLKTKTMFPYNVNVAAQPDNTLTLYVRGNGSFGQFPLSAPNPPARNNIAGDVNPQLAPPYPNVNLGYENQFTEVDNFGSKFLSVTAAYNPPTPFPLGEWDSLVMDQNGTFFVGAFGKTSVTDIGEVQLAKTIRDVPIPDLMGTKFKVNLLEQQTKLNDIRAVDSDKIMYEISLDNAQIISDGRTLASARLVNCGIEAMKKHINGKENYDDEWRISNDSFRQLVEPPTGFGAPVTQTARQVISQPINVAISEINSTSDPVSFVINANQGSTLDKSVGSIIKWGSKFPFSELNFEIGHYLNEPVGDPMLIDNEANKKGFYDLNNEVFASTKDGHGALAPVFYNQQIQSIQLKFSVKTVALW